jgi:hypothetical protein
VKGLSAEQVTALGAKVGQLTDSAFDSLDAKQIAGLSAVGIGALTSGHLGKLGDNLVNLAPDAVAALPVLVNALNAMLGGAFDKLRGELQPSDKEPATSATTLAALEQKLTEIEKKAAADPAANLGVDIVALMNTAFREVFREVIGLREELGDGLSNDVADSISDVANFFHDVNNFYFDRIKNAMTSPTILHTNDGLRA